LAERWQETDASGRLAERGADLRQDGLRVIDVRDRRAGGDRHDQELRAGE